MTILRWSAGIWCFSMCCLGAYGTNGTKRKSGKDNYNLWIGFDVPLNDLPLAQQSLYIITMSFVVNRGTQVQLEILGSRETRCVRLGFVLKTNVWKAFSVCWFPRSQLIFMCVFRALQVSLESKDRYKEYALCTPSLILNRGLRIFSHISAVTPASSKMIWLK